MMTTMMTTVMMMMMMMMMMTARMLINSLIYDNDGWTGWPVLLESPGWAGMRSRGVTLTKSPAARKGAPD